MGPITIVFGLLLTGLGVWSYYSSSSEHVSITAAIPAFVGIPLILCGLLALKDNMRKHAMHGAAVFGLVGCLGALVQVVMLLTKPEVTSNLNFSDDGWVNTKKLIVTGGMALLCGVFVVLCVRSFIAARIAQRKKAQETPAS